MSRTKIGGPSMFCEWLVGTTIPAALGPPRRDAPGQGGVHVEVSMNDDTGCDGVLVTYPSSNDRSGHKAPRIQSKKVRFEKQTLGNTLNGSTMFLGRSPKVFSDDNDNFASRPGRSTGCSGYDEECIRCNVCKCEMPRKRSSSSKARETRRTDLLTRATRNTRKSEHQSAHGCADLSEDGDSAREANASSAVEYVQDMRQDLFNSRHRGCDNNCIGKITKPQSTISRRGKNSSRPKVGTNGLKSSSSEAESINRDPPVNTQTDRNNYRIAVESSKPTHRKPNLVEPIRAQVLQTERVLETPEDPSPNAFFDPVHNIVRIYLGPVYGSNEHQQLYSRRQVANERKVGSQRYSTEAPYNHSFGPPFDSAVKAGLPKQLRHADHSHLPYQWPSVPQYPQPEFRKIWDPTPTYDEVGSSGNKHRASHPSMIHNEVIHQSNPYYAKPKSASLFAYVDSQSQSSSNCAKEDHYIGKQEDSIWHRDEKDDSRNGWDRGDGTQDQLKTGDSWNSTTDMKARKRHCAQTHKPPTDLGSQAQHWNGYANDDAHKMTREAPGSWPSSSDIHSWGDPSAAAPSRHNW